MRVLIKRIYIVVACTVIAFSILLSSARAILPAYIEKHQAQIQQWAQQALGKQISIGKMRAKWRGLAPSVAFYDLVVHDQAQHEIVRIDEILVKINVIMSLLHRRVQPSAMEVRGSQLNLQRGADQRWHLFNKNNLAQNNDEQGALAWLLLQQRISVSDIRLNIYDANGKRILEGELSASLANHGDKHHIWGGVRLRSGAKLRFISDIDGALPFNDSTQIRVFLLADDLRLPAWLYDYLHFQDMQLADGRISLQTWFTWQKGRLQKISGKLALKQGIIKFQQHAVKVQHLSAKLSVRLQDDGFNLELRDLLFKLPKKPAWPLGYWHVQTQYAQANLPATYQAHISFVRLQDLRGLMRYQSAFKDWRVPLLNSQLRGDLSDVHLKWHSAQDYFLKLRLADVSVAPWKKLPGMAHISGQVQLNNHGGQLSIDSQDAVIDFAKLYPGKVPLQALQVQADWQHDELGWMIEVNQAMLRDRWAQVQTKFKLKLPNNDESAYIDMQGQANVASIDHVYPYLPASLLNPDLLHWLSKSLVNSAELQTTWQLQGQLNKFPFIDDAGVFKVDTVLNNVTLNYHPQWPALQAMQGHLLVDKQKLSVLAKSALIAGNRVSQLKAVIPDVRPGHDVHVTVAGQIDGELASFQQVLINSPLAKHLTRDLSALEMQGPIHLGLNLDVPLSHRQMPTQVNGDLDFQADAIKFKDFSVPLEAIRGRLHFEDSKFSASQVKARILEHRVNLEVSTLGKQEPYTRINIGGQLHVNALAPYVPQSYLRYLDGQTTYKIMLDLPHQENSNGKRLMLYSDLQGLSFEIPFFAAKPKDAQMPFSLVFNLNQRASKPSYVDISLGDNRLHAIAENGQWEIDEEGKHVQGHISWPDAGSNKPITVKLSRLKLQRKQGKSLDSKMTPQQLPNLSFECAHLMYDKYNLGAVQLRIEPKPWGARLSRLHAKTAQWELSAKGKWHVDDQTQFTELSGVWDSEHLAQALASWHIGNSIDANQTHLRYQLKWPGSPQQFSLAKAGGRLVISLRNGEIYNLSESAQGQIGFGRMLNFLSLPSLRRRIDLGAHGQDRDRGLEFDVLRGDFDLAQGIARTENTYLDGPVAYVGFNGNIDSVQRLFDAELMVTPHITGSLPVVVAIAGGPVAGLVTWFANKVTAPAVGVLTRNRYRLHGSWDKPTITKLGSEQVPHNQTIQGN